MSLFNYECDEVKRKIEEVSPNYPQLTTYEKEWLYFHKYHYIPGIPVELECETVSVNPTGSVSNAIPFQYKSAILKGNTFVNLCKTSGKDLVHTGTNSGTTLKHQIEANKWYYMIINVKENTMEKAFKFSGWTFANGCTAMTGSQIGTSDIKLFNPGETGVKGFKLGYSEISEHLGETLIMFVSKGSNETLTGKIVYDIMFLEYQEGMENWDIPYFEDMKSVQMPVLTTTGKNLSPVNTYKLVCEYGQLTNSMPGTVIVNNIKVKPNTKYILTYNKVEGVPDDKSIKIMTLRDKIINPFAHVDVYTHPHRIREHDAWDGAIITTESDAQYITITTGSFIASSNKIVIDNIQLEEYDTPTPYEPYKSNILTVNDPVELRGVGEVHDELNLLTGELTQHIGEIVLDGSNDEKWALNKISSYTTHTRFHFSLKDNNKPLGIICTELKCDRFTWIDGDVETEHIKIDGGDSRCIFVYIQKSKLTTQDVNGFKSWLQTNPLTIQYILETPTIKTVDLTPLNKPYDGTNHYELTSNIPCEAILEVPVVSTGEQTLQEINNY